MKLFTVGPVNPFKETNEVYQTDFPYFRTEEYGELVKTNLRLLGTLLGLKYDNNIIYLTASGTAAMEATIENCLNQYDKALIINGGSFGHRFCQLCTRHNIPYDSIDLRWDEELTNTHLQKYAKEKYTALLVNLHETSTGQLYNIEMLSDFCKKKGVFLIVDAISTFLADPYDMSKYDIDVTIFSSQKGLSLSPGLSFIALSQRMLQKIQESPQPATMYFSFADYLSNIVRGQTPYTPAVCIMYELEKILDLITKTGLNNWLGNVKKKALYFRERAKTMGLTIPETYKLSNMLTPIVFNNVNAYDVFLELQNKYQIYVNPCSGELATKMLRISHIGNTTIEDFDDLLTKIQGVMSFLMKEGLND